MPKKEESPLKVLSKEADTLKKKVDSFVSECEKVVKNTSLKDRDIKLKDLYNNCKDTFKLVDSLHKRANDIKAEDEPSKVKNFEDNVKKEIKKIDTMKEKLTKVEEKIKPDEIEEEYLEEDGEKKVEGEDEESGEEEEGSGEDEESGEEEELEEEASEEEDEEEGEEEESEEEEETEKKPKQNTPAKQSVKVDVEEEESEYETDDEEGTTEEETEEEEGTTSFAQTGTMRQYITLGDYKAADDQPDDLSFVEGEVLTIIEAKDGNWLLAENGKGKRGLVPITYLKVYNKYQDLEESDEEEEPESPEPKTPRSGRDLWSNIKKSVNETSVTDVLHAMGAVPAGFRQSYLAQNKAKDQFTMKNYLAPKLSSSCLSYRDIFFNPDTNRIRSRNVRVQRIITLVAARQIPPPGTEISTGRNVGLTVTSRHVRVCLFDGTNILSNIHTMKIGKVDKDERTWNFNAKMTDLTKSVEFGELFVRTNSSEGNIGILFELCLTYIRSNTNQEGEFSCGWVHFPLFEPTGSPVPNNTQDLFVSGGTPFEKGVDVDPSVGRKAGTSMLRSLMSGNKQPRLVIRVSAPTKEQKDLLDTLPDTLVSSTSYIQYLSFYRLILTDTLLRDCIDPQSTELIHSPFLATFPDVVEQPDIMDTMRSSWLERFKIAKRAEKRDQDTLKDLFHKVYMEQIYPLCFSASMPAYRFADRETEQERGKEIQRLQQINRDKKSQLAMLLSSEAMHKPFDIAELSFNIVGPYCAMKV